MVMKITIVVAIICIANIIVVMIIATLIMTMIMMIKAIILLSIRLDLFLPPGNHLPISFVVFLYFLSLQVCN